ncbi:MAG: universal stress protein [Synechococcales cyanobacterium T60_A2020_003]|nr:universal stress protein [Synechococcales cyanobacterium T60_A2020_003]
MFKKVLFPIDHTRESLEAAETVIRLVQFCNSQLTVLSVVPEPEEGQEAPSFEVIAQLLEKVKSLFSQQGIPVETLERKGKPAFAICDVADEIGADVIVMACRGLGLTEEGASDSVSNRVINLAPCPVLVVP